VALIRSTQELPDGRSNISRWASGASCWSRGARAIVPNGLGRVEEFDDEPSAPGEAEALAAGVRDDFSRLVRALGVLTDREHEAIELPAEPAGALLSGLGCSWELDVEAKRSLQALRSTTARLRHLGGLLEPLAADAERRGAVRRRAQGNGRGGRHPRIEHTA